MLQRGLWLPVILVSAAIGFGCGGADSSANAAGDSSSTTSSSATGSTSTAAGALDVDAGTIDGDPNADLDHDGLLDGLERTLALRFAPEVRIHPQDTDLPANVDWYLQHVSLRFSHAHCPDHQVVAVGGLTQTNLAQQTHPKDNAFCEHTSTLESDDVNDENFYLQAENSSIYPGLSDPADWRLYAHVSPSVQLPGGYALQYWFFYAYDTGEANFNHEADWEGITVFLKADQTFDHAYYNVHTSGTQYTNVTFVRGTHPVVYSAKGSHASYPSAGTFYAEGGVVVDHTADGGPVWQGENNLVNLGEIGYPLDGQAFLQYGGRFGPIGLFFFTSGPNGPGYHGDFDGN